ncbi:MAG TPA: gamma-glutamyltransferase, partial [Gaiellaceae bacterium]|nr:gamma-glutamyltransferase [Gaiellaceae bacterium]
AWETLLSLGGRRTLAEALDAAITHAEDGVPVARSLAAAGESLRDELAADEGTASLFLRQGAPLREGEPLRQPALGRTLRAIAADGPAALYRGEVGARLLSRLRSLGSRLTPDDLAAHETELARPVAGAFGGLEVLTAGPNSQGFVLLEILAALEACGDGLDVGGAHAGVLARLFALAASDRERLLADPRFVDVPLDELLSPERAAERARLALGPREGSSAEPTRGASGDTVAVVAADGEGYAASLIQSVFFSFGALIADPATGILVHNRGATFSLDPASPNVLEGRKRPAHTLMPVLVREGGRIVGVNGTMGGRAQPQIHTHLLLAARAGAAPADAVRAPRWTVVALDDGGAGKVVAERDVAPAAVASIRAAGFDVETVGELDEEVGHAQAIRIDEAGFAAGSDPRADGTAVVA